jgi:two-component system, response regulator PdtaR
MPPRRIEQRRWRLAILDADSASRAQLVRAAEGVGLDIVLADGLHQDVVSRVGPAGCDVMLLGLAAPDPSAEPLMAEVDRAVVLCSANTELAMLHTAQSIGAMAFLVRPVRPSQIVPTLTIAVSRFEEHQSLSRALAERKVIEQAKGRLMALHGTSEEDAFRWLRCRAMDTRSRLADVARDVLKRASVARVRSG